MPREVVAADESRRITGALFPRATDCSQRTSGNGTSALRPGAWPAAPTIAS